MKFEGFHFTADLYIVNICSAKNKHQTMQIISNNELTSYAG